MGVYYTKRLGNTYTKEKCLHCYSSLKIEFYVKITILKISSEFFQVSDMRIIKMNKNNYALLVFYNTFISIIDNVIKTMTLIGALY